ncbi:MAG: glycosyltransferase [Caldilineales bacterium]|nr:glycosyltransferase [Caldilineales bacterium]
MNPLALLRRFSRRNIDGRGDDLTVRYLSPDSTHAAYGLVCASPPIFVVAQWLDEDLRFTNPMEQLYGSLAAERAFFILIWQWHIDEPERVAWVYRYEHQHKRKYPGHRFIHLCNSVSQLESFHTAGLEAILCSHNALIDERIYRPLPDTPKRFDAVYDARLKDYKRHRLASGLDDLALIYAVTPGIDDPETAARILGDFDHAHLFNRNPAGEYVNLEDAVVNACLDECRVGLCLSAIEDANYASIQYLLAGLPVVSTPSKGGRDLFFDDSCTLIVDETPEAVAAGVEEMVRRQPDTAIIRQRTLAKVAEHRQRFVATVQNIYDKEGVGKRFADEWDSVFFNRMVRWQSHEATLTRLHCSEISVPA